MNIKVTIRVILNTIFIFFVLYCLNSKLTTIYKNNLRNNAVVINLNKEVEKVEKEEICDLDCIFLKNKDTMNFIIDIFGANHENILNDLYKINNDEYILTNIGKLRDKEGNINNYSNFEEGFIEYMFTYSNNNPNKISNNFTSYSGNSNYIIDLIKYFTNVYTNVDYITAISIAASESGNFRATHMIKCNNIYGGMYKGKLIRYKNIEYGVLTYIRLLSNNYYKRGLNTIEKIGKVYCPVYQNGVKIASPHWINLVYNVMNTYKNTTNEISIVKLINKQEN